MKESIFVLMCMVFMHIVDDYYLQGILANMKQKSWWEKNAPALDYKHDYKVALFMHGFSWSFMIQVPIMVFYDTYSLMLLLINAIVHAVIDNQKANKLALNLIEDQTYHMSQIILTWFYVMLYLI